MSIIRTSAIANCITFENTILFKNKFYSQAFLLSDFVSGFKEMEEEMEEYSPSINLGVCSGQMHLPSDHNHTPPPNLTFFQAVEEKKQFYTHL